MKYQASSPVRYQSVNKLQLYYVYINTHKDAHKSMHKSIEVILKGIKIDVKICVTCGNCKMVEFLLKVLVINFLSLHFQNNKYYNYNDIITQLQKRTTRKGKL